ncbi:hypothetical protein [Gloeocapsa sp. PCC 73106]|uniref:hypothetical protein n=1 Tax=Gloeocapsa sp. PCC 73106 TaxID=102232 RepID=UPI0002ABA9E7|nr:hypothetical protein [Gloeocapsa sp. PCC 73106]ELR99294.1 hypothetical protein GLO73106DRAFT_00031440 [Gloeocapsa sp. PCC 73106]
MFSKEPQDFPPETKTKLQEPVLPTSNSPITKATDTVRSPEVVTVVEKISAVISPYFIVLVGLYLYDNDSWFSFLLGVVLIITGVLSILKISGNDLNNFWAWVKKTLGYDNETEE